MNYIEDKINAICDLLKKLVLRKSYDIKGFKYISCGYKTNNRLPKVNEEWIDFIPGSRVGGKDAHYWFHKRFKTPSGDKEKECIFQLITGEEDEWDSKLNPQALIYLNGKITQGLDVNHTEILLDFDTEYDMYIYFYAGMIDYLVEFKASINLLDKNIEKLYYDICVPLNSCKYIDKTSENYFKILKILEMAVGYLDLRQPLSEKFYESIDKTIAFLKEEFYCKICGNSEAIVNCIGHTHIDVAYLWTLKQTVEKTQRSFATVINLMKQYPEYKFMSSQPQLYKYVKESAPELFEEIKEKVEKGRWEAEGAMWLEADCNISSGESLIRQILYGKRFMKNEFNIESKILWLPDSFGYNAALPQIIKKSGLEKFLTSKISWNEYNKFPYDSFIWEGIDGTQIFTHFITTQDLADPNENEVTIYNGYVNPSQVLGAWKRYQQKPYNNRVILPFGYGDGGGGPTKDMLEQQRRLSFGIPGMPKTEIKTIGETLDTIEQNFEKNCTLLKHTPKWVGELYLEYHRGTYTSIAKNKKNNRKSELLYQLAETISILDKLLCEGAYPKNKLNSGWETILLNQFHDILPGSSIFEVYEDSDRQYEKILKVGNGIVKQKVNSIIKNINTGGGLWVYNPHSFVCCDVVNYQGKKIFVENIPAFGWKVVKPLFPENDIKIINNSIENKYFKVSFNENGNIVSFIDKEYKRELIKKNVTANQLQVFEDIPKCYDAWEISNYYKYKMWSIDDVISIRQIDEGARAGLEITKKFLNSTVTQNIFVYENIRRIDFDTIIDWHEEHLLLKVAFPFDIHTNKATYDIQFGNIERATNENTSWEQAKFEVCAQKWADISDGGYGVSIINDCKYGHSIEGSTVKLTLLKCATYPNPHADKGLHQFTYSIYPHKGDFKESKTVQAGYILNRPLIAQEIKAQSGSLPTEYSLLSCSRENVIIETIKLAEDSDGIIIRLYEAHNRRDDVTLQFSFKFDSIYLCDMMENDIRLLEHKGNEVTLPINNFEIITLKIYGERF